MAASVESFRAQNRDLRMVMKEVDEDLAIFLGMRNGRKERNSHLLHIEDSDALDQSIELKPHSLLTQKPLPPETVQIVANDNFEVATNESDCNCEGDVSLLPSEEMKGHDSSPDQIETSNGESISMKSKGTKPKSHIGRTSTRNQKPTPRAGTPTRRTSLSANSKATLASSKPIAAQSKPSTASKTISRSSTPTISVGSKSASRSNTPTRKPATSAVTSRASASDQSSSGRKNGSTTLRNPVSSLGMSCRQSKPSEKLSSSHDAPPKRPASASRGRPAHLSSSSNGKPRQTSCSPSKARATKIGNVMLTRSRGTSNGSGGGDDDVNPVLMGTKMVERVVNMRKLAPPKQDEYVSDGNNSRKTSSLEKSGFGRSLSKKSLDMAVRHMDIRRSIPENLRPVVIAASSSSSGRGTKSRSPESSTTSVTVSESPLSDNSNSSNCCNSCFLDGDRIKD